jgi:hypothetical protein
LRKKKYEDYKKHVQQCAMAAGVKLPLVATRDHPLLVDTVAYFETGVHPDPENIRKGIADALFYVPKGMGGKGSADKHTGGSFPPPKYDRLNPRVKVTINDG